MNAHSEHLHIVCPSCLTVNRVLTDRLEEGPTCGSCGKALLPGAPIHLDERSFAKIVGRSQLPVLVDFWAPWCGPCKMMAPAFDQAARRLHPSLLLAKVDTQQHQALGAQLGVQSIPTLVLFREGRELARSSGARGAEDIVTWALQHV